MLAFARKGHLHRLSHSAFEPCMSSPEHANGLAETKGNPFEAQISQPLLLACLMEHQLIPPF